MNVLNEYHQILTSLDRMPGQTDIQLNAEFGLDIDDLFDRLVELINLNRVTFKSGRFYPVEVGGNGVSEMETDR